MMDHSQVAVLVVVYLYIDSSFAELDLKLLYYDYDCHGMRLTDPVTTMLSTVSMIRWCASFVVLTMFVHERPHSSL
jgi:hypothetical protein